MSERALGLIGSADEPRRYELRHREASGGEGTVYLAYDRMTGANVAVKMLRHRTDGIRDSDRKRWDTAVNRMSGARSIPGAVRLHETFECVDPTTRDNTHPVLAYFLVMDWVDGLTFFRWSASRRGDLTPLRDAAATIDRLHKNGLIHGDIKPANIKVSESDARLSSVVVDLGRVRSNSGNPPSEVFGANGYMDPALLEGCSYDESTDLFGFAASCVYGLTGAAPPADLKKLKLVLEPDIGARATEMLLGALVPDRRVRLLASRYQACQLANWFARLNALSKRRLINAPVLSASPAAQTTETAPPSTDFPTVLHLSSQAHGRLASFVERIYESVLDTRIWLIWLAVCAVLGLSFGILVGYQLL